MSLSKKIPSTHHDREASLSTYKLNKSPSQVSTLPEETIPSLSDFIFGDSDGENNAQNSNRMRPETSNGCFVRRCGPQALKGGSSQGFNMKKKLLDIDPDEMFNNFGSLFNVRFISDEEYTRANEEQKLNHLRRELLPEFDHEEVKVRPAKTVIRLKRRTSDHPGNQEKKKTQGKVMNAKLPSLGVIEQENSFSRDVINRSKDYIIRKTSREKVATPLLSGKPRVGVEGKSKDRTHDVVQQNSSQYGIKIITPFECTDNEYSLNEIKQRSRGNSRVLRDLSCSRINENEEMKQGNNESPTMEDIPKITKQILRDITNYNHKTFKPYFPFENNKENEQRKTDFSNLIGKQHTGIPQAEYFSRESMHRNMSLPRDFDAQTDRSFQEPTRKAQKFFLKNPKATFEIPRPPGNLSQRPSFLKEDSSITSRTENQQLGSIKVRERKAPLVKVSHPPLKVKVKKGEQQKKEVPVPKAGRVGVPKNPVMNYVKIMNEIWGKDGKRATSVPRRVY